MTGTEKISLWMSVFIVIKYYLLDEYFCCNVKEQWNLFIVENSSVW